MSALTLDDRIMGVLWCAVVGDAMGVPVEFCSRAKLQRDPVTDLREFGTYNQQWMEMSPAPPVQLDQSS